jgi:hypothetical protein
MTELEGRPIKDRPRARRALVAAALVAGAAVFVRLGPPVCPTALFLGIPCPGCGLTRATIALLHGDVSTALRFHPLVFVLAPVFAIAVGSSLVNYVNGGASAPLRLFAWFSTRARVRAAWGLLVVSLAVWGARFAGYFGGPAPVQTLESVTRGLHAER